MPSGESRSVERHVSDEILVRRYDRRCKHADENQATYEDLFLGHGHCRLSWLPICLRYYIAIQFAYCTMIIMPNSMTRRKIASWFAFPAVLAGQAKLQPVGADGSTVIDSD